jgi:UDP-GlcNAc3NAcA epimerase
LTTILHIVGNRPQFIKLAVLYKELVTVSGFSQKIIHTGQHWSPDMSEVFFSEFEMPPIDVQLDPVHSISADEFIGQASMLLQKYFRSQKNSIAFVYGDTNTTLAAAFAARRTNTPLFHFEAGIRTEDKSMPEEINRILTDRIADTNYCCTRRNYATMLSEGYNSTIDSRVLLSGDLMYDAFLKTNFSDSTSITNEKNYVLATIHRASNILSKENLGNIIEGLNKIHEKTPVIMPLHPHTKKRIEEFGFKPNFIFLSPLGYSAMKGLLCNSFCVITDSGGLSREAFFSEKKSVIIMEKPFWPEIIDAGCSINISPDESLEKTIDKLSELKSDFLTPIFGDGNAARVIKEDLLSIAIN